MHILGPLVLTQRKVELLLVGIDYFTKYIEEEAISNIIIDKIMHLYSKQKNGRFEQPKCIVLDNRNQLVKSIMVEFFHHLRIHFFLSWSYTSKSTKKTNKVFPFEIKKNLDEMKILKFEELH